MRYAIVAVLVAIPTALLTWVLTRGALGEPGERCDPPLAQQATTEDSESTNTHPVAKPDTPEDTVLRSFFAEPLEGFAVQGELMLYDEKGLFEYINGAAPLFIDRGFRKLAAAEMVSAGGELTCDVYDMATAENATAIYDKESPPVVNAADIGDAARIGAMSLVLRKGSYYIKLTAFDDNAESALPALAKILIERMS